MKKRLKATWTLFLSALICFMIYFVVIPMSSTSNSETRSGPIVMEFMEPTPGTVLRGTVSFKVKIVAGNPSIAKRMMLEFVQDGVKKTEPFEMWYIRSSPPHDIQFWYAGIDASKIPDGKYDVRIVAYDSEDKTVGELTSAFDVGQSSSAQAYRDLFGWLGGVLSVASAVAYWRKI